MEFQSLSTPLFLTFLLLFMMKKKGWWPTTQDPIPKLPPGPSKLPIIGNIHHILGPLPHRTLRDLAHKHGPIMHLRLGHVSTIVVTSPKLAKEVMKTHDLSFATRPRLLGAEIMTYGCMDVAFAPYSDYWRYLRKICTLELLSAKRVESFRSVREEEASNLIRSIQASANQPINLTEKIFTFTNNVISRATIGKRCKDREQYVSVMKESIKMIGGFSVSDLFPSWKFLPVITGMKFRVERIHREFDRILADIIEERKRESMVVADEKEGASDSEDLLDVLLKLQQDGDFEFPITTNNVKAILLDMFGAGTDTSSTAIEWAMSEMMRNPRVMEKAQTEVRQALKGKTKMDDGDTNELHYLKLVIKETLRLHPPAPLLLPRECTETCEIDGYDIPIKARVIINAWAIGRDPQHWEDPESFKPERFDGSPCDYKGTHFEYLPFGAGRRVCPGMISGIANVVLPIAQLLYYFDWKLPGKIKPEDLDMTESFGATVSRRSELYLIPLPRNIPLPRE
ncbi:desmethyl-deoxy-podophyllotoxin synthase-like [Magnolia sinica]|uniref:desmethyl-deoxy-podophyllotoxin synthase-like n=1 Tax=Magnolia sinica TaxID=86752 RepID=UPI002658BDCE|nr:desmethyl-deoxy-podophyllotoxin synthase-like [Magnolia sinica]